MFALSPRLAAQTFPSAILECAKRFVQPSYALCLRGHQIRIRYPVETATPIRKRNAILTGNSRNHMLKMLNILFELMVIHCYPR